MEILYHIFIFINIAYALYLTYWLISSKKTIKSLNYSYLLLGLTMILIAIIPFIELVDALPGWPWHIVRMIALFLFMISITIVLKNINQSLQGYEQLVSLKNRKN